MSNRLLSASRQIVAVWQAEGCLMIDDFSAASLDAAWTTSNLTGSGPSYSLSANPGHLRLVLPSGAPYDQWVGVDNAGELARSDMGSGNFAIETQLQLITYTAGDPFQLGLAVRFGPGNALLWGITGTGTAGPGIHLEATRSGTQTLMSFQRWNTPSVYLRLEKSGDVYTFYHKAAPTDRWVNDGQYTYGGAVSAVGLIGKTWTSSGAAASADFDYFEQVVGPTVSDDSVNSGDSRTFSPKVKRYTPLAGPLISIPPNSMDGVPSPPLPTKSTRVQVPNDQPYDHWTSTDNAPQLQRTDMGGGDWTVETVATLIYADRPEFHAGLMVQFSRYDLMYFGLLGGTDVQLDRSGSPNIGRVSNSADRVWLRITKLGTMYTFDYKTSAAAGWSTVVSTTATLAVQSVGLIAKTWSANQVAFDFEYLDVTHPLPDAGSGTDSSGHTDDFSSTTLDPAWSARIPTPGPGYSVTAPVGAFTWSLPATRAFDHWTSVDDAPQLRRTDMGDADWTIETKAHLNGGVTGNFHGGLLVGFGTNDCFYFGFGQGTDIEVDRSGMAGIGHATNTSPVVLLRVAKLGTNYAFEWRTPGDLTWHTAGTTSVNGPVQFIGLIVKTWSPVAVTIDFDYFEVTRTDPFDESTIDSAWSAYVPASGPVFALSGGSLQLTVPSTRAFDHWTLADDAPQLRRTDMGGGDWVISTRVTVSITSGTFQTGLFVRFGQYDLFYWGFDSGSTLILDRTGTSGLLVISTGGISADLRIAKVGHTYLFYYRLDPAGPWRLVGVQAGVASGVSHVGVMTKTWSPIAVISQFDYFDVRASNG